MEFRGPSVIDCSTPITTQEQAERFLADAKLLGEKISKRTLVSLQKKNNQVIDVLTAAYSSEIADREFAGTAIVIPARNELFVDQTIQSIIANLGNRKNPHRDVTILVAANGEDKPVTAKALRPFLTSNKRKLRLRGIDVVVRNYRVCGKSAVFDRVLTEFHSRHIIPETLFFIDADVLIDPGCFEEMEKLLGQGNVVVGAMSQSPKPQTIIEAMGSVPFVRVESPTNKHLMIAGRAFAINTRRGSALFRSSTHAFPGALTEDALFSLIIADRGIPAALTSTRYLHTNTPSTLSDVLSQADRWRKGLQQGVAVSKNPLKIVGGFKLETGWKEWIGAAIYPLLALIDGSRLFLTFEDMSLGGPLPSIYRARGWESPKRLKQ